MSSIYAVTIAVAVFAALQYLGVMPVIRVGLAFYIALAVASWFIH